MGRINSKKFYKNAIKKHGVSPQGVCWISKERQELRFELLFSFLPTQLATYTIADAGCGFGHFYHFLQTKKELPAKYTGLDMLPEMCQLAKQETDQEIICADILRDTLPPHDFYVCSGAMNILTFKETKTFIEKCYAAAKQGFIFNVLYGDKESEIYNYLNKTSLEKIAQELGVSQILYRDDYLENDITMAFLK